MVTKIYIEYQIISRSGQCIYILDKEDWFSSYDDFNNWTAKDDFSFYKLICITVTREDIFDNFSDISKFFADLKE